LLLSSLQEMRNIGKIAAAMLAAFKSLRLTMMISVRSRSDEPRAARRLALRD
jgi:hypothetical protein